MPRPLMTLAHIKYGAVGNFLLSPVHSQIALSWLFAGGMLVECVVTGTKW